MIHPIYLLILVSYIEPCKILYVFVNLFLKWFVNDVKLYYNAIIVNMMKSILYLL